MLIAQVLTASTGGIGRHVASLLPRLADRGHQLKVFCPDLTASAQGFGDLGFQVLPLSALAQARGADVVHAHGYKAGAWAAAAALGAGPPLVVTWHNAVLSKGAAFTKDAVRGNGPVLNIRAALRLGSIVNGGWSVAAARLLQRVVARAADLTLGASSDLVEEALRLGAPRARLGPVAAPSLPSVTAERAELRSSLGLGSEHLMVLTVSRLAPQKNLDMVLDVAAALRDRPGIRFFVVGVGPVRDHLAGRIATEGSPVALLGRREDIANLLSAADVALLTSTWEARALVAQEALLSGLPLVSTRVGGIAELVGDAAVLVELGDVAGVVHALEQLADEPARRDQLRDAGLLQAASWPDEDEVALDVLAAYREVLSEARRVNGAARPDHY